jgi:hypothetical protein
MLELRFRAVNHITYANEERDCDKIRSTEMRRRDVGLPVVEVSKASLAHPITHEHGLLCLGETDGDHGDVVSHSHRGSEQGRHVAERGVAKEAERAGKLISGVFGDCVANGRVVPTLREAALVWEGLGHSVADDAAAREPLMAVLHH